MAEYKTHNLGGVEVTVGAGLDADVKKWEKNLKRAEKQLESFVKRTEKWADRLEQAGKKLMLGVTAPLAAITVTSIKTAAEMEAFSNNFNQSFREMSDSARAWSHEFGDAVGRSRLQMETMMSMTQSMVYPMLENREAAAQMSQAITQLAIDLASFYDVADDEALSALRSGLIGNSEPMRRFGVVVLDATLELEAQRIGLQKTVAQMSEAEKMLLRYVQILRQTSDAHGDAIRNQHEFGNQLKMLQADFENLRVEIGEKLMPYATALLRWVRDLLSALSELDDETVDTLVNFGVWAASAGILVWTLGKVIRAVAGVSKGLQVLFRLMSSNPWLVLGAVAGGMLLTIDEVQDALENMVRKVGLGGFIDTIEDVTGALDELLGIASDLEFDTRPDPTAYIQAMEDARKAAEAMLLNTTRSTEDAAKALAKVFDKIRDGLTQALALDLTVDDLLGANPFGWTLGQSRVRTFLDARTVRELERVLEMRIEAVRRGLDELLAADVDPFGKHAQALVWQQYVRDMQEARRELHEAQTKELADAFRHAMDEGSQTARAIASALGEPFDELEWKIAEAREALEEQIKLNIEIGVEWDRGTTEMRTQLATLLQEQAWAAQDEAERRLLWDTRTRPMLLATALGGEDETERLRRKRDYEMQRLQRELEKAYDDLWIGSGGVLSSTQVMALMSDPRFRALSESIKQLDAELAQAELDERLREIGDALRESLAGGARYEVEQFLAQLSGEDWDGVDYQMRALTRALWDQIGAMQEAGKGWQEIEQAVAPVVEQYAALSETKWHEDQRRALERIRTGLDRTLDTERWVEAAFLGSEFDALQFEADALADAMRSIAAEMMARDASLEDVLAETSDLQARLAQVQSEIEQRDRVSWLEDQFNQAGDMLQRFSMDLMFAATPAGILGTVLDELADPVERLLRPIAIMASGIGTALEPAFRALFPVLKGFGLLVLNVVMGISTVWNAIVGTLGGIFGALANISILGWKPLAFLQGTANFFLGLQVDTDSLSDAMKELRDLTWDQADATKAATQALHNVPSGFKAALARFRVAQPVSMPSATTMAASAYTAPPSTTTVGGSESAGGNVIVIQGDVYGWDDFKRQVAKANGEIRRSNSLSQYGTTVGVY